MSLKVNYTYIHATLAFLVSRLGLTTLAAQPVFTLRAKLCIAVMKCKNVLIFWLFFSKCTFLRLQHFFLPSTYPVNSNQFYLWSFECIRFMSLIKYFFPLGTFAMITEIVSFPISMSTILK